MASDTTLYLLIIAFMVLSFIYLMLTLYGISCTWRVLRDSSSNFFAKTFYICMTLTCLIFTLVQGLFVIQAITQVRAIDQNANNLNLEKFQYLLYSLVYLPDALFFLLYLSLFWYFLILLHKGYLKKGNDLYNNQQFDPTIHANKIKFIMAVYVVFQLTIILMYNFNILIGEIFLVVLDIGINASIPLGLLIAQLYLNVKFSGAIFSSSQYELKTRRFSQLTVFWAFMRIPQLALNVLALVFRERIFEFVEGKTTIPVFWQILWIFFGIGDFLLSTVIPFQIAMNQEFMDIFLMNQSPRLLQDQDFTQGQQVITNKDEYPRIIDIRGDAVSMQDNPQKGKITKKNISLDRDYNINIDDLFFDSDPDIKKRQNGLGTIRLGEIQNQRLGKQQMMIFRQIQIEQLSTYVVDEIKKDIVQVNSLSLVEKHIVTIFGYSTTKTQFILIYKNYKNGSLHSILHQDKEKLIMLKSCTSSRSDKLIDDQKDQYEYKIVIAIHIAEALDFLHTQSPPICHGHLTPHNIMFTKNFSVRLGDLSLTALKKYCSVVNGYSDKSQYSAPEVFSEKGNLVVKNQTSKDIYSFGLILYEIFTETIPFADLNLKQCQQLIEEQQSRPKMKDSIPKEIQTLIQYCWQQDPLKRPDSKTVIQVLKDSKNSVE